MKRDKDTETTVSRDKLAQEGLREGLALDEWREIMREGETRRDKENGVVSWSRGGGDRRGGVAGVLVGLVGT